jgi:HAD superfamily hydrolase (TIGR01509 family)
MANYGVLWDMDGVLVDTGELHYQSWVATLNEYGLDFDHDFFVSTFGMNNAGILTLIFGYRPEPALLAEIGDKKEAWFREALKGNAKPMPGVVEWLSQIKAWGFHQAVASSGPMTNIQAIIEELQITPYFDALISASTMPSKPDPAVFLESARQIRVPPQNCLVIEDAIPGVQAAKRAGMKCIAVLTTNPASVLADADVITGLLEELPVETVRKLLKAC